MSSDRMLRVSQLLLVAVVILSGCVTNKKYVYLQKDDVNKKELPKDRVVREYSVVDFDYRVQPNDLISVQFSSLTPDEYDFFSSWSGQNRGGNINLTGGGGLLIGELVDENGEIMYPVLGKVKIGGLTVFEIQEKMQQLANQYLEEAVVKVRLLNYRITLLGEVNSEGTVLINNNRASIIEAIGMAGGLTDLADKRNIKLLRQYGDSVRVSYLDILSEDLVTSPYFYVHQNDVLIVPALRQRPYRRYFGQNLSLIISSISLFLLVLNLSKN